MVQTVPFWTRLLKWPLHVMTRAHCVRGGRDSVVLGHVIDVHVALQRHVPMVVETVLFWDMVIYVPVALQRHVPMVVETRLLRARFWEGAVLGKVVDTPVVFNDRGHGPDSAVLDLVIDVPVAVQRHVPMVVETVQFFDKVIDVPVLCTTGACGGRLLFLRQLHMGPDVHKTCGGAADAVLRGLDVSVTMQRLCGVDGDGAVEGSFRRIFTTFSASSFGVEALGCQFMPRLVDKNLPRDGRV